MAEKLDMKSMDILQENVEKIKELFPNAVTEVNKDGKVSLAVDFEALKQELSEALIEDKQERYQMTWPDKSKSKALANTQISATLRPIKEESVDFDNTKNLYIEGDNLDVLKLLRETYLGKIKMIYVDPPYNTGNDFVYNDDFAQDGSEYLENSGQYDEQGNRLVKNLDSNGRYHTKWLNMIYPRLKIARDLLKDDGIIFISIDDNEVSNLKKICDEIFYEKNFIAQIIIEGTPKNDPLIVSTAHEYCLVYVKNYEEAKLCEWGVKNPIYDELLEMVTTAPTYKIAEERVKQYYKANGLTEDNISNYNRVDERGLYRIGPIDDPQGGGARDTRYNPFTGETLTTPKGGWRCSKETWEQWVKNGEILFPEDNSKLCSRKVYIEAGKLDLLRSIYKYQTRKDTDMLKAMFGVKVFQFPKPLELIKTFIDSAIKEKDEIVMDFFSGSATTAHAVMQLNAERQGAGDGGIKFILVQVRENLELNLKAAQGNREKQTLLNAINFCKSNNVPPYLTEIGKERIRRAGQKIKNEYGLSVQNLDVGFRVFRLDSSNMQEVYYNPHAISQTLLDSTIDNIKPDRTSEDLLFQVMLDLGVELSAKIEEKTVCGKTVFAVNGNDVIACFDENITNDVIVEIAKKQPLYAVFRDKSFATDSVGINNEQLFKTYSPATIIKVL